MYSASVVESADVSCFELFQLTGPLLRQNTKSDCDRESSLSVWKLTPPLVTVGSCLEPLGTFSSRYYLSGAGTSTRPSGIGTPLRVPILTLSIGTPNGYWNFRLEENAKGYRYEGLGYRYHT
ncbi:hypothetical protein GQ457_08G036230 [Hibiscus cannabinus]